MNASEPDYENPSVVRINSIALGLMGCFLLTLLVVWWVGRGAETPVEGTPGEVPTPDVAFDISTPAEAEIVLALQTADINRGSELYREYGCVNCHLLNGEFSGGPALNGIAERIPTSYESPEAYLADAILDPSMQRGDFADTMPNNYDELFDAQDVADLIVFLLAQ